MPKHFIGGSLIGCDTETTGLDRHNGDRPYLFTFANTLGDTAAFRFPVDPFTREVLYHKKPKTFQKLAAFFADKSVGKVFHNSKFDFGMIEAAGLKLEGLVGDTELKLRLCDSSRLSYQLKPVCKELFEIDDADEKALISAVSSLRGMAKKLGWKVSADGPGADYWLCQYAETLSVESRKLLKTFASASANSRRKMLRDAKQKARGWARLDTQYGTIDAERAIVLDLFLEEKLDEYGIRHVYEEEIQDVWPVVYAIEQRGVFLNREAVLSGRKMAEDMRNEASEKIRKLCKKAKSKLVPETFANSYPQKVQYFLNELQLEPLHYSKERPDNAKLDHTFLEFYEKTVPMAGAIMSQTKADKAISTYFDAFLSRMDSEGILHGSFQQIGAKTGRFSAREPNLQNIPKRGKPGDIMLEVRRPFGPRPGFVWYLYDFKQIEARIFADEANEETMLDSFRRNSDVYQDFADVIKKLTRVEVSRQDTKSIFLGKLYGLGRGKLVKQVMDAAQVQLSPTKADKIVGSFDEAFPGVSGFMQDTIRRARKDRCVFNRYGQRIDVDPEFAYTGVNYIIQSTAARLMKRAMVKAHKFLEDLGFGWLLLTIHDELIFEFPKDNRPKWVIRKLAEIMSDNEGKFPLVETPVDVKKTTGSWLDTVDVSFLAS